MNLPLQEALGALLVMLAGWGIREVLHQRRKRRRR